MFLCIVQIDMIGFQTCIIIKFWFSFSISRSNSETYRSCFALFLNDLTIEINGKGLKKLKKPQYFLFLIFI